MTPRFPRLNSILYGVPLAILEDRMDAIVDVVERRMEGIYRTPEEIAVLKGDRRYNGAIEYFGIGDLQPIEAGPVREARQESKQSADAPFAAVSGNQSAGSVIAVINVMGIISQHAHQVDDISGPGGTSTERVAKSFRSAIADPNVAAIVFNHDSPGGSVNGVQSLAEEIFAARGKKPIISQVNSQMASAAYWIGAASDEVVITPGGQAGSIGVYMMHKDVSKAADEEGVKVTFIKAGKFKTEGNPFEALGEEAASAFQSSVDSYYSDFTKAVAKFRGVSAPDVRGGFGQGRMVKDHEAVKAGLADSVATLDETLRRVSGHKKHVGARAEASESEVSAEEQTPAVAASDESDAWRRRRHAHRQRS